ncbi:MAG: hypothetical protein JST54_28920 [Deltaproteobacteria bacterium]|nr:hypothetical protein [Deltaproteobacteria bacterium]
MAKKSSLRTFPFERELDGVKYFGTFTLDSDSIEVTFPELGSKTAKLDGATARSAAGLLLGELVAEKKKR